VQRRPQEHDLEFVHHHYLDHLQRDLVERNAEHVGLLLTALTDTFEQDVRVVGELLLDETGIVHLVTLADLHLRRALGSCFAVH
jgi:hypothetical protein